jgi:hypothetical protein
VIRVAPASIAFSASSRTAAANESIVSPAAIARTTSIGNARIVRFTVSGLGLGEGDSDMNEDD